MWYNQREPSERNDNYTCVHDEDASGVTSISATTVASGEAESQREVRLARLETTRVAYVTRRDETTSRPSPPCGNTTHIL